MFQPIHQIDIKMRIQQKNYQTENKVLILPNYCSWPLKQKSLRILHMVVDHLDDHLVDQPVDQCMQTLACKQFKTQSKNNRKDGK